MALEKILLELPALGGLNQENEKWIPAPFSILDNYYANKTGAIEKRRGWRRMTREIVTFPNRAAGNTQWNNLYCVTTSPVGDLFAIGYSPGDSPNQDSERGTYLWSYSEKANKWVPKHTIPGTYLLRRPGIRGEASMGFKPPQAVMVSERYLATLYHTSTSAVLRIEDTLTGAVILNNFPVVNLSNAFPGGKVVMLNLEDGFVTLFYFAIGATQPRITRINPQTGTSSPSNVGAAYSGAVSYFDAVPGANGEFVYAAIVPGSPSTLHIVRCSATTSTVLASTSEFYSLAGDVCSLAYTPNTVTVIWDSTPNVVFREYSYSTLTPAYAVTTFAPLSSFFGGIIFQVGVTYDNNGRTHLFVSANEPADSYPGTWYRCRFPDGTGTAVAILPWAYLASKPFALQGDPYVLVGRGWQGASDFKSSRQYGFALLQLNRHPYSISTARPFSLEGVLAPTDGVTQEVPSFHLTGVDTKNPGRAIVALPVAGVGARSYGEFPRVWGDVFEIRTSPFYWNERLWRSAFASGLTHLSGTLNTQLDGSTACEIAFLEPPQLAPQRANPTIAYGTSGLGGTISNPNTYSYYAHWEWLDSKGNLHRSRLSDPISVTIQATSPNTAGVVTIEFTTTGLTRRGNADEGRPQRPRLAVYRTLANGTVYYRCRETSYNLPEGHWYISFTDDESDSQLLAAKRGELYTTGGILECETPPSARHIQVSGGRVWITSAEAPEVWPSRLLISGEAPAFSPLLRISLDDAQTPLVGTAWLDGSLVIFSESRIYTVNAASGPSDNGLGQWPRPEEIQSSSGCVSAASIVSYSEGVLYRDRDGIKLLTRSREVIPLGDAVRDYTDAFPDTYDAVLDEANSRILILVGDRENYGLDNQGSIILVWDYGHKVWSTWSMWLTEEDEGEISRQPWLYARLALWKGDPITTLGVEVLRMNFRNNSLPNLGLDNYSSLLGNQWVIGTFATPWVSIQERSWGRVAGGLGGYQRVWRAVLEMEKLSNHGLKIEVFSDGEESTPSQTELWTSAQVNSFSGLPRERLVVGIANQKCAAIKLKVTDTPPSPLPVDLVTGVRYHKTTLELGVKRGVEKAEKPNTR